MKGTIHTLLLAALVVLCLVLLVRLGPADALAAEDAGVLETRPTLAEPQYAEYRGVILVSFGGDLPVVQVAKEDAILAAKLVWGEARGVPSDREKAAVIWCALNRVDATGYACGRNLRYVVTFPNQFTGYRAKNPVTRELYELAIDVLARWQLEKVCDTDVGRVLPFEYQWFVGYGGRNHFRDAYRGGNRWDWSLEGVYDESL